MIYVSLVEILSKVRSSSIIECLFVCLFEQFFFLSVQSLKAYEKYAPVGVRYAPLVTMFTFFGGVVFMALLDALVHRLDPDTELHEPDLAGDFSSHHINVIDHMMFCEFRDAGATAEDDAAHERHAALTRDSAESKRLKRMGLMTGFFCFRFLFCFCFCMVLFACCSKINEPRNVGLCILLHNFPEGLATFVGALADTTLGVGLAVAIGE